MLSFSNGIWSGEVSNKQPLENGCMLKYKSRKVSAVRAFPPGCGPNAVPVHLRPEGSCGGGVGCADALTVNGAETSVTAALVESEAVGSSELPRIGKVSEKEYSEIQNVVDLKTSVECQSREVVESSSSLTFRRRAAVNGSEDAPKAGTLDKLMDGVKENESKTNKLVVEIRSRGTQLQEEAEGQRQEEVNNLIEIQSDEPVEAYVGEVITAVISDLQKEFQDVTPELDLVNMKIHNRSGGLTMSDVFKEDNCLASLQNSGVDVTRSSSNAAAASIDKDLLLNNPLEFSVYCGSTRPETSIRTKDKYCPRRVSAVRNFPPYCGANALLPIEKERGTSILGKDSENNLDGLHNIHVEIEVSEMSNDGAGRGFLREMKAATADGGSIEPEEYRGDLCRGITERTGSRTMPTSFLNTNIDDASEPVGKEIAVLSPDGKDKDRPPCSDIRFDCDFTKELVHGLMAAPYCSWRISKAAPKNSEGGTGDLKMRKQNVPLRKKPKNDALKNNLEMYPLACSSPNKTASNDSNDGDETTGMSTFVDESDQCASNVCIPEVTPISMFTTEIGSSCNDYAESVSKDAAFCSPGDSDEGNDFKKELVHGLVAAPYCSWRKSKASLRNHSSGTGDLKTRQQNVPTKWKPKSNPLNSNLDFSSLKKTASPDSHGGDETPGMSTSKDEGDHCDNSERILEITPISMFKAEAEVSSCNDDYSEHVRKDIVVCSPGYSDEGRSSDNAFGSKDDMDREVLHCLMAEPFCPWKKEKTLSNSAGGKSRAKKRKQNLSMRQKAKAVAKRSNLVQCSGTSSKKNEVHFPSNVDEETHDLVLPNVSEASLPCFGPSRSDLGDARNKVRRVLQLFHSKYRKLLQQEESESFQGMEGRSNQFGRKGPRQDVMIAQVLKDEGEFVNSTKMIGPIPGVEVGDEFQYRVELAVVGIHFPYQSGIDTIKVNDTPIATSIVTSGAYFDDVENDDVLIYSGQGGNVIGKAKQPEDQKMERGNLALKNSIEAKTPVRVVRGWKEKRFVDPLDVKPKMVSIYVYDGLYTVTNYWTEKGPHGKQVFKYELKRNPGQPELAWKELKSNKSKTRPGVCVPDISGGKERIPISAVNTLDDDKPPQFNYTPKMLYPDWYSPNPPDGCNCNGRCSKSKKCGCAARNEGDIPYNNNGALVETKPLVYECGPHCKCPPSCYNRVTQRGITFQLEVFKTESRGWGVRALTSIPSGSFICEYAGELLKEKIADERIGSDEYLFDIGQNLIAEQADPATAAEPRLERGHTIDALTYGNVGRFVNHSCSPNLHAQNVIYDNDDKSMPHIMLFAMENIPPLTELTYHYNYSLDQVYDSDGNIKVKKCYCGALGCSGRMY